MIRLALFILAIWAAFLFACSEDPGPFFTPPAFPENQETFNQGHLGLLTPALTKENEIMAFRLLSGLQMSGEMKTIGARQESVMEDAAKGHSTGLQAWVQARQAVSNPPLSNYGYINRYRSSRSSSEFVSYLNCLDDAFETAARTLGERQQYYSSADLTAWVQAQDQVFANCSSEQPAYPEALPSQAPPQVRADREYQIAAAHFYAEDLPEAERRFRAIAADAKSPWQHIGKYMVGRTLLREVSLGKNTASEPLARRQLAAVVDDSSAGSLRTSAQGLIQRLDAVEHPDRAMTALSKEILLPQPRAERFADVLQQSAYMLTTDAFNKAWSQPDVPELFDWVRTLENGHMVHAREHWNATHSLPWLTVSLLYASGKDPAATELIANADRLSPDSPAYGTATYNAVRMRIERGETAEPRKQLDELLAHSQGQPDSLVNAWRAERMRLAASFDDLLRWAPRKPIHTMSSTDDPNYDSPVLASDAAYILNYRTPLSKLAAAVRSKQLPPWSAVDVAISAWTRAVMLSDAATASAMAPLIAKAHPQWASELSPIDNQPENEWKFRAALLIALHHEFQPLVPVDYRKHFDFSSWWCSMTEPNLDSSGMRDSSVAWHLPVAFTPLGTVFSPEERRRAVTELRQLQQEGSAQSFLAPIIFAWAKSHPDDPLVPQALHRLVMVVRYGCSNDEATNGRVSKAAFDQLHKRYPRNEWTAKTPYWFR